MISFSNLEHIFAGVVDEADFACSGRLFDDPDLSYASLRQTAKVSGSTQLRSGFPTRIQWPATALIEVFTNASSRGCRVNQRR